MPTLSALALAYTEVRSMRHMTEYQLHDQIGKHLPTGPQFHDENTPLRYVLNEPSARGAFRVVHRGGNLW